jgi:hypothetical protein
VSLARRVPFPRASLYLLAPRAPVPSKRLRFASAGGVRGYLLCKHPANNVYTNNSYSASFVYLTEYFFRRKNAETAVVSNIKTNMNIKNHCL